ncbi:hypothetical protein [Methanolinea mesophila]|uniref:hypothetical protein n=1 Tax=Methanolinea mesophila TaxID=547055 RepID=UPI001AEABCCA|nr:hypothetical protein [Methanolinea mesophila]
MIIGLAAVIYGVVTFQWLLMLIVVAIIVIILIVTDVMSRGSAGKVRPRSPEEIRMHQYEESINSISREIRKI